MERTLKIILLLVVLVLVNSCDIPVPDGENLHNKILDESGYDFLYIKKDAVYAHYYYGEYIDIVFKPTQSEYNQSLAVCLGRFKSDGAKNTWSNDSEMSFESAMIDMRIKYKPECIDSSIVGDRYFNIGFNKNYVFYRYKSDG